MEAGETGESMLEPSGALHVTPRSSEYDTNWAP